MWPHVPTLFRKVFITSRARRAPHDNTGLRVAPIQEPVPIRVQALDKCKADLRCRIFCKNAEIFTFVPDARTSGKLLKLAHTVITSVLSSPHLTHSSGVLFDLVSLLHRLSGPDTLVPRRLAPGVRCCQDHPRASAFCKYPARYDTCFFFAFFVIKPDFLGSAGGGAS